ncbi:hypothetical protein [Nocardia sp. NPDC057030]|uniref:hypothetical protein n=1 Tax=unclassified Nocardia TaxID=2637762 RepID=UPI003639D54D
MPGHAIDKPSTQSRQRRTSAAAIGFGQRRRQASRMSWFYNIAYCEQDPVIWVKSG